MPRYVTVAAAQMGPVQKEHSRAQVVQRMIAIANDNDIHAVPTYVLDGRFTVPGAQDPDTFVNVIRRVLARRKETAS